MATDMIGRATAAFEERLRRRFPDGLTTGSDDVLAAVGAAADFAIATLDPTAVNRAVGRAAGPVYDTTDVARWLTPPDADPLTGEAVRKRIRHRQLAAFRTDDGHWVLPAWQFDRAAGQLVVRRDVIDVWARLPHDAWMPAVDLAVWMNTRLRCLDATPAEQAHRYGADAVEPAIDRLRARVAGAAA